MFLTVPNAITAFRLPWALWFYCLFVEANGAGSIAMGAMAASLYILDMIDGRLGRLIGQTSKFGAWWDISVDRFHDVLLLLLAMQYRDLGLLWIVLFCWLDFSIYMLRHEVAKKGLQSGKGQWSLWVGRILYVGFTFIFSTGSGTICNLGRWIIETAILLSVYNRLEETWHQRQNLIRIWSK